MCYQNSKIGDRGQRLKLVLIFFMEMYQTIKYFNFILIFEFKNFLGSAAHFRVY